MGAMAVAAVVVNVVAVAAGITGETISGDRV